MTSGLPIEPQRSSAPVYISGEHYQNSRRLPSIALRLVDFSLGWELWAPAYNESSMRTAPNFRVTDARSWSTYWRKRIFHWWCQRGCVICNFSAELLKAEGETMIYGLCVALIGVCHSGTIPLGLKKVLVVSTWKGKGDHQHYNSYHGKNTDQSTRQNFWPFAVDVDFHLSAETRETGTVRSHTRQVNNWPDTGVLHTGGVLTLVWTRDVCRLFWF